MEAIDRMRTIPFPTKDMHDPVVITGIGLVTSTGSSREAVWESAKCGKSGVKRLVGLEGIPDGLVVAATIDAPQQEGRRLKVIELALRAAEEAWTDAGITDDAINANRCGAAISANMGDTTEISSRAGRTIIPHTPWYRQWLPNTAAAEVIQRFQLLGPATCHSTACASSLVDVLMATRTIEDGQADLMLVGGSEAIHPLLVAGFNQMRVLANDENPAAACRPFDRHRKGFVMGEGAGFLVLERLSHALNRNARIYAEVRGGKMFGEAKHVTGLDAESDGISRLITDSLRKAKIAPDEVGYISAHGTGTVQNDRAEAAGIRRALGSAANSIRISSMKSMLGHLVNASGAVELALTALALRDGYLPPTINYQEADPECDLDCLPNVGRHYRAEFALKVAVAFGGHLVSTVLRRWPQEQRGFGYPMKQAEAA